MNLEQTEPTIGGAIAESILEELDNRGVFGVMTLTTLI